MIGVVISSRTSTVVSLDRTSSSGLEERLTAYPVSFKASSTPATFSAGTLLLAAKLT